MFTAEERKFVLPRKSGDRLIAFVFGCVLTGFFALMHVRLEDKVETGWLRKLLHGLAVETMFTFGIFSLLALIWALFTPRWLESLVSQSLRKVLATIAVVLTAAVFTVLYYTL
jgi:uncharacterized membrane protein YqjE